MNGSSVGDASGEEEIVLGGGSGGYNASNAE